MGISSTVFGLREGLLRGGGLRSNCARRFNLPLHLIRTQAHSGIESGLRYQISIPVSNTIGGGRGSYAEGGERLLELVDEVGLVRELRPQILVCYVTSFAPHQFPK